MGQRIRAIARATPEAAKAGVPRSARRTRAALYATTALQAAALLVAGLPARAQPAANARPAGGQVSSGSAAITSNATTTLVRQASQNAVINWQNFNIGSAQTVQYAQPGASSFTLNRVISANPSQIAGHILANGRVAIVNQSGVVFLQGSTVDTAGLVVSAAGITDQDFMAGRLVFVQPPQPGAVVSNAGNITIRQAGLAALVAPQVANSGTITAVLGRVVLGGAATHTLDMYGDGLVALNVTGQVTEVQLGGRTVTALVTNTGTILAPGGTVVLTAQAADGVVSKLISASGTISAPTLGGQSGRVLVSGVGGDIEVDGAIQATGASGGSVTVAGNRNVTVASGGVLDASGAYGGGAVKLLAPTGNVTVAPGAALRARGTLRGGRGGRITVQAGGTAGVHGTLDASGATTRDAGGTLAVSGGTLSVDGLLSANLPGQPTGHAAFTDKGSLTVQFATCAMGANCLDFASFLNDLSTIVDTDGAITFVAGKNAAQSKLTSAANISLTTVLSAPGAASGDIIFDSGTSLFAPDFLVHAAGNIDIYGLLSGLAGTPATSVTLTAGGDINEHNPAPMPATSGTIDAQALIVSARNVVLDTASNSITTLGSVTAAGNFTLDDASGLSVTAPLMAGGDVAISVTGPSRALTISSAVSGVNVTFDTGSLSLLSDASVSALGSFTAMGNVTEGAQATIHANTLAQITGTLTQTGGTFSAGTLTIGGDVIQAGGILSAGSLATIGGSLAQTASSTLTAGTLSLGAMGQAVSLTQDGGSAIILGEGGGTIQLAGSLDQGVLSHITAQGGTLSLIANGGLTLAGLVSDQTGTVDLLAQGAGISQSGTMGLTGTLLAGTLALQAGTIGGAAFDVHLDNVAVNHIEVLSDASVSGNLTLADNDPIALMAKATVTVGGTLALSTSLLSMSGGGSITASSFALTGNLAQQTGDSLTASGQASVDGSLSQIGGSLSGGTVTIAGGVQQSAGGSLGAVGALTIDGSVAQNASTISAGGSAVIRGASFLQNGSTLSAGMLSIQSGTFSQSNDGQGASSAIDVGADGTTIALTGNLTQDAGSSIVSGGTLSLTGNTLLLAGLVSDSQGTVMLGGPATQLITETASGAGSATGSLQAGTLVAQAAGGIRLDTVSGPGVGNAIVDLGRISAGPTFALADGVAVTLNGTLSASSVALRAPSLTVSAGAAIDAQPPAGAGAISIGADRISLVGTLSAPAGLVAIGLLHPGTFSVVAGGTIDPTSLEHVFTGPVGTIALGSTNGSLANGMGANLTWDAASTGAVSTLSVLGAIDLSTAANAGTLGLFSNGGVEVNVGAPSNGVTVATLYGAAAGDFLAASSQNLIQAIGPTLTAQGGTLVLTDAGTLTLLHGARVAGNNGVTLSALGGTLTQDSLSAIDSASGMVELDSGLLVQHDASISGAFVSVSNSVAQDTGSSIAGDTVMLATSGIGSLSQSSASSITATGLLSATLSGDLTQSADSRLTVQFGDISLASSGGSLLLGGLVAAQGGVASLLAADGSIAQSVSGSSPTGTLLAGTLITQSGTAGGPAFDLLLNGTIANGSAANRIGTISRATATGQLWLTDAISAVEAASGHIAAAEVMLTLSGQTLTQDSLAAITSTNSLAIGAATLVQTGASIESTAGNVTLTLANGLAQDSASRIIADAGNIVASSIGTLAGDGPVSLAAGGSISATAGLVQLISLGGDIAQTAPGMTDFTGVIDAASLAVQAGVPSGAAYNLLLGGGHNRFGTLVDTAGGTYSGASGSVLLADQAPLALAAGATLLAGGNATITLTEPATLTQDASSLITAGGSVTVQAATLTQLGGAALTGGTGVMVAGNLLQTGQDQVTATQGDVTVTGSATQTFSAITAQGDATIGSLSQTSSSLTSGGAVIIGPAQAATGALVLDQHAASMISAGTSVTVYGAATQDVSRLSAIDQVVIYGSLDQTGSFLSGASVTIGQNGLAGTLSQFASSITAVSGDLTVTMSGDVAQDTGSTLASPSGDILLTTTGGQMALGGLISVAPQHEVSLVALGGDITQTAPVAGSPSGTLLAGTLSAQAGSAGGAAHNLVLDGAGVNQVGTVTQASATGTLLLIDSEALQESANGSITGQSGVTITAPNLTQLADSTIGSEFGAVQVRTNLLTQDRGASISAQSDVLLGGSLDQVSSTISSGRELSINGGLITQSSGSLTGAGGVLLSLAGNLMQDSASTIHSGAGDISITSNNGNLDFAGSITAPTGQVALQAGAGLIEGNGTVQAGTLAAQAAGDIVLSGAANQIASVGPVSIAGGLTQAGMVSSSGSVILADSTALLLQNASISGPGAVQLSLAGNLTEAATGTIVSNPGSVTITGGGAASLAGSVSGGFGVSIGFAGSLTEAATGTVMSNAGSVTIIGRDAASLAGSVSGASGVGIEFAGNLTEAATGTVMSKAGSVTITGGGGGSLAGSVLGASGVGIGLAGNLTEAATGVIASTAGPIVIGSPGTLSFAGTLSATRIVLGGPALVDDMQLSRLANATATPQRIEWSGGFVMTGSAIPVGPGEPDIKSPISPTAGTLGLFATAASFSQTGQTKIGALPGASAETVEFTLVGQGGLIAFDPSTAAGLFAPGTQLLLDLQAGGRAIGNIDVAGLNLYFGQPPTGNASLTGLVDGRGGSAAAATGFAHQMANTNYRDNGCPVQSLNCVLLSPVVVPLGSPVQNLVVAVAHDQDEDDDLILPNVAEQDY